MSNSVPSWFASSPRPRLPAIELASFVDPRRVPQMGQAEEVVAAVGDLYGAVRAGLALNERGYERLVASGLDEVRFSFGVTETFNQRNQSAPVTESLDAAERIVARARADGLHSAVTLSVAFGCPFEGAPDRVVEIATRVAESEPDTVVLADTIGVASPSAVRELVSRVIELGPPVGGHFHNTRNTGYANALSALGAGATVLDASVGGLGGCPFAPNATGNIATEDLVYGAVMAQRVEVVLSDAERETLERWARRAKSSQALAFRCRVVLAAAESLEQGDRGRALEEQPANAPQWPTRAMAAATGMSQSAVSRIWRAFGLKAAPHRGVRAVTGSAAHRQGPRRRRALSQPARSGGRALRR